MRTFIAVFVVLAAASGYFAPAADAALFQYLTKAANEISQIDHSSITLSDADAATIAKIACEALTDLVEDPDFERTVQDFAANSLKANGAAARELINDIARFNEEFRRTEAEQLSKAGLAPPAISDALWAAATQRDRANVERLSAESITKAVTDLKATACGLRDQLAKGIKSAAIRRQALLIGWGFAGAVLITVDIGAGAFSGGSATVVTAASTGLGVAMIGTTANALAAQNR